MKKILIHIIFLVCAVVVSNIVNGQTNDAFSYIEKYNQRMDSIRNYAAVFTIKSDIKLLELPDVTGKIFFKWPAHYSISTDGYTILPKNKLVPIVRFISRSDYKAVGRGTESVNNRICKVIDLFPVDTSSHFDHFVVWIDPAVSLVRRILIQEKDKSKLVYQYLYNNNDDLLPAKLVYTFEVFNRNKAAVSLNPLSLSNDMEKSKEIKGSISVDFNYTEIRHEGEQY